MAGCFGGGDVSRQVRVRKWSDGVTEEQVVAGCNADCMGAMTRSRVLPWLWVGNVTCCWRLCAWRRSWNCFDSEFDLSFTWILKSPVMRCS